MKPSDYQVEVREFDTRTGHLFFLFSLFFFLFFSSMGGGVLCMYVPFFFSVAVFGLEHLISYCNYTKRSFGPPSGGQGRRLCHAMPNYRPGEVNPKPQLPFCCRSPCESRDCCAAVAVPSGSELPSSLMLIQYIVRARHLFFSFPFFYLVPRYVYVGTYVPGLHPPPKKNRKPIDEIAPKKQSKYKTTT